MPNSQSVKILVRNSFPQLSACLEKPIICFHASPGLLSVNVLIQHSPTNESEMSYLIVSVLEGSDH